MKRSIGYASSPPRILAAAMAMCAGMLVLPSLAHAADVTGNATLTSDYVWRGSTQTHGDPAVQAGIKVAGDSGLYATVWASNVEFAPETRASSEFDFTVGWDRKLSDAWAIDLNVLHYHYPSTTIDLNWTELNGTVTYADDYWLSVGYSPEALGSPGAGAYTQLGARFPVNDRFRIEAMVSHYFLDQVYDESYSHAQLNAVWTINPPFELRLSAHATDGNAKDIFGEDFAGTRLEAAVQASF